MTTETSRKSRRTTMEELPVLDEHEREQLLASLKTAKAEIDSGRGIDYDPKTLKDRLVRIYRDKLPGLID